ncbi:MAG: 3-deoxy-D-manno-octulosonic acid transferase [Caulobacteraceae bacterium]
MSLALALYRTATGVLEPLAPALLQARMKRGKEDAERLGERLGRPSRARQEGPLCWLHGASVGETLSILPLVEALHAVRPELGLLVTSGTVTSAELLATRLPRGVIHQFLPVDAPRATARFLAHWRPDLAVFVESELWPNLLTGLRRWGARTALVSARLSDASLKGWGRAPAAAKAVLGGFDLVMAQDGATAAGLVKLGARDDGRLNLKLIGAPLAADPGVLAGLRTRLGERPVLLAASTHPGEDELLLEVFAFIKDRPELPLLVLAPRHPVRGEALVDLARGQGFRTARQSTGETIAPPGDVFPTEVYVADVLGELGLWFRLAKAALIGGSLVPGIGGHNPLEAARLDCPVVTGPHVDSWRSVYQALEAAGGVRRVGGGPSLAGAFAEALIDPAELTAQAVRARAYVQQQAGAVDGARDRLLALLPSGRP